MSLTQHRTIWEVPPVYSFTQRAVQKVVAFTSNHHTHRIFICAVFDHSSTVLLSHSGNKTTTPFRFAQRAVHQPMTGAPYRLLS
mmetsp:Transcript_40839/g.66480  ORF Transcript_40839/g.66480 Transcript_40839/m.66480 type:complete len:84 (+) Transcript_40839:248-499(+)